MKDSTQKRLLTQGFCFNDVGNDSEISAKARWTPLSCATLGTAGIGLGVIPFAFAICPCTIAALVGFWTGSGWFFIVLGLLTYTGGLTNRSFYDRVYNATIRHLLHKSPIPEHGAPRKFGCAIGGVMYVASGIGFLIGNFWLAYAPAVFMIVLATIAGLTHWCFASAIYKLIWSKN